jgi:hypothetical protein
VGTPALIFVLAGVRRRSAPALLASAIGLISLGVVLGVRPLVSFLRLVVPQFSAMHLHQVGFFLFCFAVAALAAFGITEVSRHLRRSDSQKRLFLKICLALIAVEAVQLILFTWIVNPRQPAKPEWLFPETPLISNLKALQGEFHVLPIYFRDPLGRWTPPVFAGKVAGNFDLRSGSGYEPVLPIWTDNVWRSVERGGTLGGHIPGPYRPYFYHDQLPVGLLEKLSVGLIATPPNTEPRDIDGSNPLANGAVQLVYQGTDGWIYKLPRALPRAFLVPQVLAAPDDNNALKLLVDRNFDARRAAIVIGEKTAVETGLPSFDFFSVELGATANIVRDRVNDVEVEVNTPRAAMLVLNDSWGAGWKVELDGMEQPALRVNYAFRGVVVPAGKHRIIFLYRPPLLLLGLGISAVTMLLLGIAFAWIGVCWLHRFRKRLNARVMKPSLPGENS